MHPSFNPGWVRIWLCILNLPASRYSAFLHSSDFPVRSPSFTQYSSNIKKMCVTNNESDWANEFPLGLDPRSWLDVRISFPHPPLSPAQVNRSTCNVVARYCTGLEQSIFASSTSFSPDPIPLPLPPPSPHTLPPLPLPKPPTLVSFFYIFFFLTRERRETRVRFNVRQWSWKWGH